MDKVWFAEVPIDAETLQEKAEEDGLWEDDLLLAVLVEATEKFHSDRDYYPTDIGIWDIWILWSLFRRRLLWNSLCLENGVALSCHISRKVPLGSVRIW